ncbi:MAG: hypothetical protein FJW26_19405 [Acidimicrobiia bacterium]|nr:hypothetical protein [Acidimicrobiia bacterium]
MKDAPFYFVQMSDAHIFGDPAREFHGTNPARNLRAAVHWINSLDPQPEFCIHTGDAVAEESEAAYRLFNEEIAGLKVPVYFAVGNHDHRSSLRRFVLNETPASDASYAYDFEVGGWHMVVLDSSDPPQVSGRIDAAQLLWLERTLQRQAHQPTVVFLHHHPLPLGVPWLDELRLKDATPFIEVLRRAPWVRSVFYGHVHFESHLTLGHLHFASVPAVSFQFGETAWCDKFSSLPPGLRLVYLEGESLRTVVHRLA